MLLALVIQNEFIFDYLKYETLRAEINFGITLTESQFLWDDKFQVPNLEKLGLLNGIVCEIVNLG